jgi:hypothetical protein
MRCEGVRSSQAAHQEGRSASGVSLALRDSDGLRAQTHPRQRDALRSGSVVRGAARRRSHHRVLAPRRAALRVALRRVARAAQRGPAAPPRCAPARRRAAQQLLESACGRHRPRYTPGRPVKCVGERRRKKCAPGQRARWALPRARSCSHQPAAAASHHVHASLSSASAARRERVAKQHAPRWRNTLRLRSTAWATRIACAA